LEQAYSENAEVFKVLAEPKRLRIIDMLSCGELCACKILEQFDVSQPTLSHDMKVLCDSGIVCCRKEGKKRLYRLNQEKINALKGFLERVTTEKEDCICKRNVTASPKSKGGNDQ